MIRRPRGFTLFPYTTLFRSWVAYDVPGNVRPQGARIPLPSGRQERAQELLRALVGLYLNKRSEEHTSELQSRRDLVCRLLLEKKKHCRELLAPIQHVLYIVD